MLITVYFSIIFIWKIP